MEPRFVTVQFTEIESAVRQHLRTLPSEIDSFLEDHILASTHYRIDLGGESAGFASIHSGNLITQFSLEAPFGRFGQELFTRLRRMEQVTSAFVSTGDELFLSHALDDYRELAKQAYFFAEGSEAQRQVDSSLLPAAPSDADMIGEESGEFFQTIEAGIDAGKLFVTVRNDVPVGFGIIEPSRFYDDVASIGMFTIERHRNQGVGADTILLLRQVCHRRGVCPVAGCWYYNHASKRTLEHAGMVTLTRLLKIDF